MIGAFFDGGPPATYGNHILPAPIPFIYFMNLKYHIMRAMILEACFQVVSRM